MRSSLDGAFINEDLGAPTDMVDDMSRPLPPPITVRSGGWQRTFAPGHDVVVGRDVRADVRIPHLGVSRSHVMLRYLDGHWVAIDDKSFNGMFVGHQRVQFGRHPRRADHPRRRPRRSAADVRTRPSSSDAAIARSDPVDARSAAPSDNDVVIPDVLASSHHASLVPTPRGIRIQDAGSANGTFVNGEPVKDAVLADDDVVTIGNVDFVFTEGNLVRRTQPATKTGGLEVHDVSLTIEGNSHTAGPDFAHRPAGHADGGDRPVGLGQVHARQGRSSAPRRRRAARCRSTATTCTPSTRRCATGSAWCRRTTSCIGELTVTQALGYAAELRMPPDTSKADRQQVIAQVLDELELTPHAQTRVDKLSGGQRKRVSVALELLTGPSLLVLDEPTTGLDPALDRQVMAMLRQLADAGRVVVVVTHSLTFLDVCDQVLLLAPGGKTAFCGPHRLTSGRRWGPPTGPTSSTASAPIPTVRSSVIWPAPGRRRTRPTRSCPPSRSAPPNRRAPRVAPVLDDRTPPGAADPGRPWLRRPAGGAAVHRRSAAADRGRPRRLRYARARRPTVRAEADHRAAELRRDSVMGTTLTVRDLVGERAIFRREQADGLSASAYLAAKIAVFGAVAVMQSAILVLVVTAPKFGKPAPPGAAALGSPLLELFVGVAATCVAATMLGLAVSALAQTSDQVIVLLAVTLVTQLVLAGGFIPVTDRPLLETISWFTPARWGFAATASTADLTNLVVNRERFALAAHRVDVVLRHGDAGGVVHRLRGDRALEDPAQGGQLGPGHLGPRSDHRGQADGEDDDRDDQVDAVKPLQHAVKQAGQ